MKIKGTRGKGGGIRKGNGDVSIMYYIKCLRYKDGCFTQLIHSKVDCLL